MSEKALQILREHVQNVGLKTTRQRDLIVQEFFATHKHVTVEELFKRVKVFDPKLSLATVYRTLKLLQASGLARCHQFVDGHMRFEPSIDNNEHHDHLICTRCGQITEFFNDEIERLQNQVAQNLGFQIEHHRMELYGICLKCRDFALSV